ncbi:MAG: flagellar protein FliS [Acidobacteria bacterium]|jgi:flagellar protein FliS|nr:MAG: flagellar protein FliS [Acidobacteriota bacterium]
MNAYLENMVITANPIRQVILLYEKMIICLEEAIDCMRGEQSDPEVLRVKYEAIGRATEILIVLDSTLNMEQGGDIAKNLHDIYQALLNELVRITVEGDEPDTLERVIKIAKELKEAWEEAERNIYGRPEADTTAV